MDTGWAARLGKNGEPVVLGVKVGEKIRTAEGERRTGVVGTDPLRLSRELLHRLQEQQQIVLNSPGSCDSENQQSVFGNQLSVDFY